MGVIDVLKKEAQAKQTQDSREEEMKERDLKKTRAELKSRIKQIYSYLAELAEYLNVLNPEIIVSYPIKGYGTLKKLRQGGYSINTDSHKDMKHVAFNIRCAAVKGVSFEVEKEAFVERQKKFLNECCLTYTYKEDRDIRLDLYRAVFKVESYVPITLIFKLSEDSSTLILTVRNFDGLGIKQYMLRAQTIDENFLDELGKYVLREENDFLKLDISEEHKQRIRIQMNDGEQKYSDEIKRGTPKKAKQKKGREKKQTVTKIQDVKPKQKPTSKAKGKKKKKAAKKLAKGTETNDYEVEVVKVQALVGDTVEATKRSDTTEEQNAGPPPNDLTSEFYTRFANLPYPYKQVEKSEIDIDACKSKLANMQKFPIQQVQEAVTILLSSNLTDIKPEKRIELTNSIIGQCYPIMAMLYDKFSMQEHGLPEGHDRREALSACADLAQQLAISYKHSFKFYYSTDKKAYKKSRDKLLECGFRILEMLRLEQRFRVLRYQKLSANEWQDCNRTFFALLAYDDVDEEMRLFGSIGVHNKADETRQVSDVVITIAHLYLSIQLFGLLDVITWPMRLFHVPDSYLDYYTSGLKIMPDDGAGMTPGLLSTYYHNAGPPTFVRNEILPEQAILIDYSVLFNRLIEDHEELAKMKFISCFEPDRLSKPIIDVEDQDRIPILEMMLLGLRQRKRLQKRHLVYGTEHLKLYFGFQESFQVLLNMADPDAGNGIGSETLGESLAEHSSLLVGEDGHYLSTHWGMVNFSAGGILLSTDESDFTSPIQIGHIVSFAPIDKVQQPLIGYVCRLHRPQDQRVEIAIVRLSSYAEAVSVWDDMGEGDSSGRLVILVQDLDEQWKLITHNSFGFISGAPLKLLRVDGEQVPVRLGDVWLTKSEFTVFDVSSPGMQRYELPSPH